MVWSNSVIRVATDRSLTLMSSNKMDLTATRRLPRQVGGDGLRLCYLPDTTTTTTTTTTITTRLNEDTLVLIRVLLYRDLLIRWQLLNLNRKQRVIRSGKMSSLWFMAPQIRSRNICEIFSSSELTEVHQRVSVPGDSLVTLSHLWLRSVWLPSFLNWSKNVNFDFYWS